MAKKAKEFNFMEELDENYSGAITDASDIIDVIPSGSISLDVALGIGGIPRGRFTEIYGAEGSGKTTLALSIAKQAITQGLRVLYCDPEQGLDLGRAEQLIGEDAYSQDKFLLVKPEFMEDTLFICESAINSKEFGLIILDSIASMVPRVVKEKELEDATVGVLPKRFGVFLTRNLYTVRDANVAFVGLNQIRDKIGTYVPTIDTPGGHQWKHDCSARIQLNRAEDIKQGDDKVGIIMKFVVKKNKLAPPYRSFTIPLMFDIGIDYYRDLIELASVMGIVKKFGGHYKFDDITLGNGMMNSIEYLKNNKDTLDKLCERCYNITRIDTEVAYEPELES